MERLRDVDTFELAYRAWKKDSRVYPELALRLGVGLGVFTVRAAIGLNKFIEREAGLNR